MKNPRSIVIAPVALVLVAALTFVATATAASSSSTLVRFRGGIGVQPVSNGVGTDPTATTVNRNIVRGVQPAGAPWVIADFQADVKSDGRIRAVGRGLLFAGGNTTGTAFTITPTGGTATLNVFATLICENLAPFVERSTAPVPLAGNGDFSIDDVLSPPPPASCATPVLLIRAEGGSGPWFAAGIQSLGGAEH
jgi:hypothetical protein